MADEGELDLKDILNNEETEAEKCNDKEQYNSLTF